MDEIGQKEIAFSTHECLTCKKEFSHPMNEEMYRRVECPVCLDGIRQHPFKNHYVYSLTRVESDAGRS